jgi:hypothetical protein
MEAIGGFFAFFVIILGLFLALAWIGLPFIINDIKKLLVKMDKNLKLVEEHTQLLKYIKDDLQKNASVTQRRRSAPKGVKEYTI